MSLVYRKATRILHALTGSCALVAIGSVQKSRWHREQVKALKAAGGDDAEISRQAAKAAVAMQVHKAAGLTLAVLVVPRLADLALRPAVRSLATSLPEKIAGSASHAFFHSALVALPATGLAMAYYGGKGIDLFAQPLFAGKAQPTAEDKQFAGRAFWLHTWTGFLFKFTVPIHVAAVGLHLARGHAITARMNPFL